MNSFAMPPLPIPKYSHIYGVMDSSGGMNTVASTAVTSQETLDYLSERITNIAPTSNSNITPITIMFCDIDSSDNCSFPTAEIKEFDQVTPQNGHIDEYQVRILVDDQTENPLGLVVLARTASGFNYAVDWIHDSYNVVQQTIDAIEIHDYPAMTERSVFAADMSADLNHWMSTIDIAGRLRIKELAVSLQKDKKISMGSVYLNNYVPELFSDVSPFIANPGLLNDIVQYARKRGVSIVPTLTHMSNLDLYNYYSNWTTTNGRAIDWRKNEPQAFLDAMIRTAMSVEGIESISVWADEGGVRDRQPDFLETLKNSVESSRTTLGKNTKLRFLLTPIISLAIRNGIISDITTDLPENSIVDFYAGVGTEMEPGTYHLRNPQIWPDIANHISGGNSTTLMTGVGFLQRSRFNSVEFPIVSYLDSFLGDIQSRGGTGQYMYLGANYDLLDNSAAVYLSHRLWSGYSSHNQQLLSQLPDSGWLNQYPAITNAWGELMTTALLAHDQTLKVRLDKSPTEAVTNFQSILDSVNSGGNSQSILGLEIALDSLESIENSTSFNDADPDSLLNLELSKAMAKFILKIRKLAEEYSVLDTDSGYTLADQQNMDLLTRDILEHCEDVSRFESAWAAARHLPLCTYIPVIHTIRQEFNLPYSGFITDLLNSTYGVTSNLPDPDQYEVFINSYTSTLPLENDSLDYDLLPSASSDEHGYGSFDRQHSSRYSYVFSQSSKSEKLTFQLFDIDKEQEVQILVNDVELTGNSPSLLTLNQTWSSSKALSVSATLLHDDRPNRLEFRNSYGIQNLQRNFVWGVRAVEINDNYTNQCL